MNVVIRRPHTFGTSYHHIQNGPLVQACTEQIPELFIQKEFDGYCLSSDGTRYSFDASNNGYNRLSYSALADGEIKEIKIQLVPIISGVSKASG